MTTLATRLDTLVPAYDHTGLMVALAEGPAEMRPHTRAVQRAPRMPAQPTNTQDADLERAYAPLEAALKKRDFRDRLRRELEVVLGERL